MADTNDSSTLAERDDNTPAPEEIATRPWYYTQFDDCPATAAVHAHELANLEASLYGLSALSSALLINGERTDNLTGAPAPIFSDNVCRGLMYALDQLAASTHDMVGRIAERTLSQAGGSAP